LENKLDFITIRKFLLKLSDEIMHNKDYLNELDAECGDGDFGVGMYIGFRDVMMVTNQQEDKDIGDLFVKVGDAILSSVGGASGPLFGTFFIEAGKRVAGKGEIDLGDLLSMFSSSLEKIKLRGGADIGDKTLVDALHPVVESLRESVVLRLGIIEALENAAKAAEVGCFETRKLNAKRGKARYLGQQTLGHIDPGAEVVKLIFKTLYEVCSFSS